MVRVLLSFVAGILLQWHGDFNPGLSFLTGLFSLIVLVGFFFFPFFHRYKLSFINGVAACFLSASIAAFLTFQKDIRHNTQWYGHGYKDSTVMVITLREPPVEKTRSLKADASVSFMQRDSEFVAVKGKLVIYFQKQQPGEAGDSLVPGLGYGSQIIFNKPLQEITNPGNPGGFDYKRYCLFQGITHQVFLKPGEFAVTASRNENSLNRFLYATREKLLTILRTFIKPGRESGLAEALLIGYRNDLDKSLVQSYSNTGVVHIIAISGLHLGLIYWLLARLFWPLGQKKKLRWLAPLLIISCLWLFSLLAGAQPSVLRSALMFTCIVTGESLTRRTNIYNTLAVSAFVLLCYNPFWLWDTGFRLSYAAVLSLVIFMRPVYGLFYFKNKWADAFWKLNAVTIAAQILALPFCIYYFHQFPTYFLLTNLLAVPLSSLILLIEIFLCCIAFIPVLAVLTGKILSWLINLMNTCIETMESLPFSTWDGLLISGEQVVLLLLCIAGLGYGLMEQSKNGLKAGLVMLLGFAVLRYFSFTQTTGQQKLIVYNIPRASAIDFMNGRHYLFTGDTTLQQNDIIRNFHLRPSRVLHRAAPVRSLDNFIVLGNCITWNNKHIFIPGETFSPGAVSPVSQPPENGNENLFRKQIIDLLILSKNPRISITELIKQADIKQVVFDASVPAWKINYWKKDCELLGIPWHDVTTKGAFAMNLP